MLKLSNKALSLYMTLSLILFSLGFLFYYYENVLGDNKIVLTIILGALFVWGTWQVWKIIHAVAKKKNVPENAFSAVVLSIIALTIFVILLYFLIEQAIVEPMYGTVNGKIVYGSVFDKITFVNFFLFLMWICGSSVYFLAALLSSHILDAKKLVLTQLNKQQIGKIQLIIGLFLFLAVLIGAPFILFKYFYVSLIWHGGLGITDVWGDNLEWGEWSGSTTEQAERAAHVQSFLILESAVYKVGIVLFIVGAFILIMFSISLILQGYANMKKE